MEEVNTFFGEHALDIWGSGIVWTIIGIFAIKIYYLVAGGVTLNSFSFKYWINENFFDVLLGFVMSLLILRGGDALVHWGQNKLGWTIPDTQDFVIVMIAISGLLQIFLHKIRKPASERMEQQRHVHNENCNH